MPIATLVCKSVLAVSDHQSELYKVPCHFGSWQKTDAASALETADILQRTYTDSAGNSAFLVGRRDGHDLQICLEVNDKRPKAAGSCVVKTAGKSMNFSLISYVSNHRNMLTLMWYQHGTETAPDRWQLRLRNLFTGASPEQYKQFRIAVPSGADRNADIERLKFLASKVYEASI
jgi:hypothetical protein